MNSSLAAIWPRFLSNWVSSSSFRVFRDDASDPMLRALLLASLCILPSEGFTLPARLSLRAAARTNLLSLSSSATTALDRLRVPDGEESNPNQLQPPNSAATTVYLLGAAALWGTYPSTIKLLFASPGSAISPGEVTLMRFLVMAIASFAAYMASTDAPLPPLTTEDPWQAQFERRVPASVYAAAAELGALGLVGTICNTWGLQQIPALTGAVLLACINIFTPLVAAVAGASEEERSIDASTWLGSLVALCASTFALQPDQMEAGSSFLPSLGAGEFGVLGAAFFFSAAKVRLSSHLKVHSAEALTTGRVVGQAGLAAAGLGLLDETNLVHELLPSQQGGMGMSLADVLSEATGWFSHLSLQQLGWVVASAMLSGACALWCQGKGQSAVSAPIAQLYFSTSPLFGALWALLLLHEPITNHELAGGAILLLGLAVISRVERGRAAEV